MYLRRYSTGEMLAVASLSVLVVLFVEHLRGVCSAVFIVPFMILSIIGVYWSWSARQYAEEEELDPASDQERSKAMRRRDEINRFVQRIAPDCARTVEDQARVLDWTAGFINRAAEQAKLPPARKRTFADLKTGLNDELTTVSRLKDKLLRTPASSNRIAGRLVRSVVRMLGRRRSRLKAANSALQLQREKSLALEEALATESAVRRRYEADQMAAVKAHAARLEKLTAEHQKAIASWMERLSKAETRGGDLHRDLERQSHCQAQLLAEIVNIATKIRRHLPNAPLLNTDSPESLLQAVREMHDLSLKAAHEARREAVKNGTLSRNEANSLRSEMLQAARQREDLEMRLTEARSIAEQEIKKLREQAEEASREAAKLRHELTTQKAAARQAFGSAGERVARYLACPESCPEVIQDTALLLEANLPLETRAALLHHLCKQPHWALTYLAELSALQHSHMRELLIRVRPEMLHSLLSCAAGMDSELPGFACAVLEEWGVQKHDLLSPIGEFPALLSGGSLSGVAMLADSKCSKSGSPEVLTIAARRVFTDLLNTLSEFDRSNRAGLICSIQDHTSRLSDALACRWS